MNLLRPLDISFVGLGNYTSILGYNLFWKSFSITAYFTFVSVFLELVIGLGIALLLNQKLRGSGFVKGMLILPWALPGIVVAGMWRWIYHPDYGLINGTLRQLGILNGSFSWLGSPSMALNSIIITDMWRMAPFIALILLAGMATISPRLYDASKIDGADSWHRFWHITLPLLKPFIFVVVVIRVMFSFQIFDLIFVLTRGGPGTATYSLTYLTWMRGFNQLHMGYGAAISILTGLTIGICIVILYLWIGRRR